MNTDCEQDPFHACIRVADMIKSLRCPNAWDREVLRIVLPSIKAGGHCGKCLEPLDVCTCQVANGTERHHV